MKLLVNSPIHSTTIVAKVAAELTGQKVEVVVKDNKAHPTVLETAEGNLNECTAIAKYLATLAGGSLLGTNAVERSQVDQWIAFANSTLVPCVTVVNSGIFGQPVIPMQGAWNEASKNLKAHCKTLNAALEGKQWLVGNAMTLADVVVALNLITSFQTTLDGGFRKAMKNVNTWAEACYALAPVVSVCGNVKMCAKALKPTCEAEKKPEKKVAPAPVKKVEKVVPKNNTDLLPPTTFNLYDFKTLYVNHPDKKGKGVDTWYEMCDWNGWSFWFLHYDIYEGEGDKFHVANNLLGGFLSRAEAVSKMAFAKHAVVGEEGGLEIMGVWFCRGVTELPDCFARDHPSMEYYRKRLLDPRNNKDDDKLIRDFMGGVEGDTLNGYKCQNIKWFK